MTTRTTPDAVPPARMPDRRPPYVRWTFYLVCLCLALLIGAVAAGLFAVLSGWRGTGPSAPRTATPGELRRDLAGKLLGAGLPEQAAEQYRLYLQETDLPPEQRANVAYTIGKLLMEQGRYEDALGWLFQVEMLDPKSQLGPEAGSKIVACLERLGRYAQAQYSLEARSRPEGDKQDEVKGTQVVARIGQEPITLRELDEAIDALPPWMREPLRDPARKEAFLQQFVAQELLVRKGRKLEMDKDPEVRRLADQAFRQLLAQKVLESEVQDKIQLTAADVESTFRENRGRYGDKEAFRVRMIQAPADRMAEVLAALKKGEAFEALARAHSTHPSGREQGGLVEAWVEEGMDPTGLGDPAALWQALAPHGEGEVVGPLGSGESLTLLRVESHRPPRVPDLEEVRQQVAQDLYRERAEAATQELIRQALQVSDVQLFPEVLRQSDGQDATSAGSEKAP